MSDKDKLIQRQMDQIRDITQRNLNRIGLDLWGEGDPADIGAGYMDDNVKVTTGKRDLRDEVIDKQMEVIRKLTQNAARISGVPLPDDVPTVDNIPILGDAPVFAGTPETNAQPRAEAKTEGAKAAQPEAQASEPPEKLEDLMAELNGYIGLTRIKREVENLVNMATIEKMRAEHGLPTVDMSLHMVFSGNPGTGKTMIARLMARIYKSLGILSKGQLVEVDRSGLVAGYVGQTAGKTMDVINKALGGVLFIDEAYALTYHKEGNDFGQEAVDTLLKAMEDHRDDLVVIVAGYIELMDEFINSNPGLKSRFNRFLHFDDYSIDEMMSIYDMRADKGGYVLDDDARDELRAFIEKQNVDPISFGNARGVRNLFEHTLVAQANRLAKQTQITREALMQITAEDIDKASEVATVHAKAPADPRESIQALIEALKSQTGSNDSETPAAHTEGDEDA